MPATFNQPLIVFITELRVEDGLSPRDAEIMARWEVGQEYTEIANIMKGINRNIVSGVVKRNRTDGYSKPRGPLVSPRSRRNWLRNTAMPVLSCVAVK